MKTVGKRWLIFKRDLQLAIVRAGVSTTREAATLRAYACQNVFDVGMRQRDLFQAGKDGRGPGEVCARRQLNVDADLSGILIRHELEFEDTFRSLRSMRRFIHSVAVSKQ